MNNTPQVFQIDNLKKHFSLNYNESESSICILSQRKGELLLSIYYDKKNNSFLKIEGKIGKAVDCFNISNKDKLSRFIEFSKNSI